MSAVKKEKKEKSPFERCCDELKTHECNQHYCDRCDEDKCISSITVLWPTHSDPHKKSKAAKKTIKSKRCSKRIRESLAPEYIPPNCALNYCCFSKGDRCCDGFNLHEYNILHSSSLVHMFPNKLSINPKSPLFALHLSNLIGTKQFDFALSVGSFAPFWVTMVGGSAFVKATGTSQRTDCITFAPKIAIRLKENVLLVLEQNTGLIGVGFCNLIPDPRRKTPPTKQVKGNAMMMIREDNIQHLKFVVYVKKRSNTKLSAVDATIKMESKHLKRFGYHNPLLLEWKEEENKDSVSHIKEATSDSYQITHNNHHNAYKQTASATHERQTRHQNQYTQSIPTPISAPVFCPPLKHSAYKPYIAAEHPRYKLHAECKIYAPLRVKWFGFPADIDKNFVIGSPMHHRNECQQRCGAYEARRAQTNHVIHYRYTPYLPMTRNKRDENVSACNESVFGFHPDEVQEGNKSVIGMDLKEDNLPFDPFPLPQNMQNTFVDS